mgnify:CR=1 FL=1
MINRGNGNSKYQFNYALVKDIFFPFVAENHCNVIYSDDPNYNYSQILDSFKDNRTLKWIENVLGNDSLSKTELYTSFPIFINHLKE